MTREELIALVDKIMKCHGSEKEIDKMIEFRARDKSKFGEVNHFEKRNKDYIFS